MGQLKSIKIGREDFFYSLSFDIDDFIGDGIWWLQLYDRDKRLIYDKPFASSRGNLQSDRVVEMLKRGNWNF